MSRRPADKKKFRKPNAIESTALRALERLESRAMLAVNTVSIADASVVEGNAGTRSLSFVVSLASSAKTTTTVGYQTVNGTATAGTDFTAASGSVTFRSGQRTAMVVVPVSGDVDVEADETFQVVLANPSSNVTLGRATATGVILDDDAAPRVVTVAGPAAAVDEAGPATFTFTLSRTSLAPVTVSYATADVTASSASDYTAANGSLTFAPGETAKTVTVATRSDSVVEADETFQMRISSVSGASIGTPSTVTATIKDVPPVAPPPVTGGSWTILVYMTGENLNTDAKNDINEMEKALVTLPGSVKIVVSWDQPKSSVGTAYATGGGTQSAWRTYGRSVLKADASTTTIASTFNLSFGEKNTGDPATLVDFVKWGVQQAPAQHYMLQMWGHGGGLDGSQFDSESSSDAITIGEMGTALATAGMPALELVSYDNCLMAMVEIGTAVSASVNGLFVASEESINGPGQDYTTAYNALSVADPASVTPTQIAAGMTTSYWNQYKADGTFDTFSGARTSGYAALNAAIKQFVDATASLTSANRTTLLSAATASVGFDVSSFRDLGGFMTRAAAATSLPSAVRTAATAVNTAISSLIASKTTDQRGTAGVSIFLPTTSTDAYLASYATDAAAFCQATGWNTFAKWLATGTRTAATATTTVRTLQPHHGRGGLAFDPSVFSGVFAGGDSVELKAEAKPRSRAPAHHQAFVHLGAAAPATRSFS